MLYSLTGAASQRWTPYIGAGPNFALSHRGFDTESDLEDDLPNRFDFGDTDFEGGVNVTLGLDFVRTSPDHGTAYNIAGQGVANPASLIAALRLARDMAQTRSRR